LSNIALHHSIQSKKLKSKVNI